MSFPSPYHISKDQLRQEERMLIAAKKDREQFRYFYERYHEPIFRFVYQRLDDKDTAADVTAQVFLKAMVNLQKFEYRGLPFGSWLYRIAKNELNRLFRQQKAAYTLNIELSDIQEIVDEIDPDPVEDRLEKVIAIIDSLEDKDIELITMRFFEKRSFRQIGEILEITENNAKVRTYRTLDKIKQQLH